MVRPRSKKRPARQVPRHSEPDRLFLYWWSVFWGVIRRVRARDELFATHLVTDLIRSGLLPGETDGPATRNDMVLDGHLRAAEAYRNGPLTSTNLRGKTRKKPDVALVVITYGFYLGLINRSMVASSWAAMCDQFELALRKDPLSYLACDTDAAARIDELVELFKTRAKRLKRKRPPIKTLAQELTAHVLDLSVEHVRAILWKASRSSHSGLRSILETIKFTSGLTPVPSR